MTSLSSGERWRRKMADTAVEKKFGGDLYRFWLPLPQVIELERKCGVRATDGTVTPKSVFTIYDQLSGGLVPDDDSPGYFGGGTGLIADARAVIKAALVGGNYGLADGVEVEVGPGRASELVDAYTYPNRPMIEAVHLAWFILHAAIIGIDVKKKDESAEQADPSLSEKVAS